MGVIKVLLYNLENDKGEKIEKFCKSLSIKVLYVKKEDYYLPIEILAGAEGIDTSVLSDENPAKTKPEAFDEEMLVLCGFDRRLLDIFLREYKKRHLAPVSLKAILTEHNRAWDSNALYKELCRERAAVMTGKKR